MSLQREREALSDALEKMQDELIKSEERCETYRSQELTVFKFLILIFFQICFSQFFDFSKFEKPKNKATQKVASNETAD